MHKQDCGNAGQLLHDVAHAVDNKRVQSKAPQQSIACTKSYHGLQEMSRVDEALHRLVFALWPRLLEVRAPFQACFHCWDMNLPSFWTGYVQPGALSAYTALSLVMFVFTEKPAWLAWLEASA